MVNKYPGWIDEYAKSMHQAFSNMMPCSWGPVDVVQIMTYLNGNLVEKVYEVVQKLKGKGVSPERAVRTFSNLSTFRITVWYLLADYIDSDEKPSEQMKEILDYLMAGLKEWAKEDIFALNKNIGHSKQEIDEIIDNTSWQEGSPEMARELGKLYNSLAALVFGLYRDFFLQEAHEIYGPYGVADNFGEGAILLVKRFSKIKPVELWPQAKDFKYEDVKILQVFQGVKYRCEIIGMHSIYEGDLMKGLIKFAVIADGKAIEKKEDIKKLNEHFEQLATRQAQAYDNMTKDKLVYKALDWLCYQFVGMFELAGVDWRPTEEMKQVVVGKKISLRYEADKFPDYEEFIASPEFEVYWLKKLYE